MSDSVSESTPVPGPFYGIVRTDVKTGESMIEGLRLLELTMAKQLVAKWNYIYFPRTFKVVQLVEVQS